MIAEIEKARAALYAIPPNVSYDIWLRAGMAALTAGLSISEIDTWSSTAENYKGTKDVESTFRNVKIEGGITAGTLFYIASEHGYVTKPFTDPNPRLKKTIEKTQATFAGGTAVDIWERCERATYDQPYIVSKQAIGIPLDDLRVVPSRDSLTLCGEKMSGSLVIPVRNPSGNLESLQFIPTPDIASRLKDKGKSTKLNLPMHKMDGWFKVGDAAASGVVYIVEGIGQAWACWKATGNCAFVCFGAGNMSKVAKSIRTIYPDSEIILVPDVGKELHAESIALEVSALMASMPEGWEKNSDVHDFSQSEGIDALELLLCNATKPNAHEPRYKLLSPHDLRNLPPLAWRVRGVLPAKGIAAIYGPSASGKSFLAFDMAASIASGESWFGCCVEHASVVYAALEGEAGFKLRAQAWEVHKERNLPDSLHLMLQPFHLTNLQDVKDLAAVTPKNAVVFIDTLNRAAPTSDENSSRDMGEILEGAKLLQSLTSGLVVLIHHTGKDKGKGLRGHSSLFAAMDSTIEVSRTGERREWSLSKSKDGIDGETHHFRLAIENLGTDEGFEPVTSCTIRTDSSLQTLKSIPLPQGGNQRLVYDGIQPLFKNGRTGMNGAPPLRPCISLEVAIETAAQRLTCESHRRVFRAREAIKGLVTRGVLGLNDGWLWTAN